MRAYESFESEFSLLQHDGFFDCQHQAESKAESNGYLGWVAKSQKERTVASNVQWFELWVAS